MPRRVRVEFAGAVYHVLDRGDRREPIFRDDSDRESYLRTLGEVCGRTGWRVHAYVLMANHYHLLLETPEPNLIKGMHWLQSTYTARFNHRHGLAGHLFQGRYKAVLVDPEQRGYFATLSDYIHLNPIRAGLLQSGKGLAAYRWSSYPTYTGLFSQRPPWLKTDWVLGELDLPDTAAGRQMYSERLDQRVEAEGAERAGAMPEATHEWCLGGTEFRREMIALLDRAIERSSGVPPRDAAVAREHNLSAAIKRLEDGLAVLNLRREDLPRLRKNDPQKIALARWIREATIVSNTWLSEELVMGHVSRVSRYAATPEPLPTAVANLLQKLRTR